MANGRKNVIATLEGSLFEGQPDKVLTLELTNVFLYIRFHFVLQTNITLSGLYRALSWSQLQNITYRVQSNKRLYVNT